MEYSPAFREAAIVIDDKLLDAMIQVESSNNPRAFNRRTKARGLTQIRSVAWSDLRKHYGNKYKKLSYRQDIYQAAIAREAGRDYLNILVKYLKAKRIPLTYQNLLTAYVWGPENLHKYGCKRAPKEGKLYVARVLNISAARD
jgi:soluble lytic murein transglycosylase-like protein